MPRPLQKSLNIFTSFVKSELDLPTSFEVLSDPWGYPGLAWSFRTQDIFQGYFSSLINLIAVNHLCKNPMHNLRLVNTVSLVIKQMSIWFLTGNIETTQFWYKHWMSLSFHGFIFEFLYWAVLSCCQKWDVDLHWMATWSQCMSIKRPVCFIRGHRRLT